MDIGKVVQALKQGKRVARSGWNGKGMYVFLARGARATDAIAVPAAHATIVMPPEDVPIDPVVCMRTASGTIQPGWLCSQADLLADDWVELPVG